MSILKTLDLLLAEANKVFSEEEKELKIDSWHIALSDVSDQQIKVGLVKALRTPNAFMLDAGSFRELCLSDLGSANVEDDGHKAWADVISRLNGYAMPVFKDAAIGEAIRRMGGWKRFCEMSEEDQKYQKKDFIRSYAYARRSGRTFDPHLNVIRGDHMVFIGFDNEEEINQTVKQVKEIQSREDEFSKTLLGMMDDKEQEDFYQKRLKRF